MTERARECRLCKHWKSDWVSGYVLKEPNGCLKGWRPRYYATVYEKGKCSIAREGGYRRRCEDYEERGGKP
jgi:hypothetical protein